MAGWTFFIGTEKNRQHGFKNAYLTTCPTPLEVDFWSDNDECGEDDRDRNQQWLDGHFL